MQERLDEYIGSKIAHSFIEAVDGSELTREWMQQNNFSASKQYRDPYYGRVMTRGEIGCVISHINGIK